MSKNPPRVGIVVRTKNRSWFLRRALNDIIAQSYRDWTVRVVNDGGNVEAVEGIVRALADDARRRIEIIHHVDSRGRSAAANAGIRALSTEFAVIHDDDDLWHSDYLSRTTQWLDRTQGDVGVVARTEIIFESQRGEAFVEVGRSPFWPDQTAITYSELLQSNRAVPISFLYRRIVHDEVGPYREDLPVVEDWEFNLRVLQRFHVGFIQETLAYWTQRGAAAGDLASSMTSLAQEHDEFDRLVRDEALRQYSVDNGPGLALYLTRFVTDEVSRQLDLRRTVGQRAVSMLRAWRHRKRRNG